MIKILGLELRTFVLRLGGAVVTGILTLIIFLYVPKLLYQNFPQLGGATGLGDNYFLYYAVFITVLSGVSTIYRDRFLGDAAGIANGLTQIYYIYIITNGGFLSVAMNGITVSVNFSTLLYFLIAPSAISVVASVVKMFSRYATQPFYEEDQILLR